MELITIDRNNPFYDKIDKPRGKFIVLCGASGSGKSRMKHPQIIPIAKDTERDERPTDKIDKSAKPNYFHKIEGERVVGYDFIGKRYSFNLDYIDGLLADGLSCSVIVTNPELLRSLKTTYPDCIIIRAKTESIDKTKEMMKIQGRSEEEIALRISKIEAQEETLDSVLDITDYVIENNYTPEFDKKVRQAFIQTGAISAQTKAEEEELNKRVKYAYEQRIKFLTAGTSAIVMPILPEGSSGEENENNLFVKFVDNNRFPDFFEENISFMDQRTPWFKVKTENGAEQIINQHLYLPRAFKKLDGTDNYYTFAFNLVVEKELFKFTRCLNNLFSTNTPIGLNINCNVDSLSLCYGIYEDRGDLSSKKRLERDLPAFNFNKNLAEEKKTGMRPLTKNYFWNGSIVDEDIEEKSRTVAAQMVRELILNLRQNDVVRDSAKDDGRVIDITSHYLTAAPFMNWQLVPSHTQDILSTGVYFEVLWALSKLKKIDKEMYSQITEGLDLEDEIKNVVSATRYYKVTQLS